MSEDEREKVNRRRREKYWKDDSFRRKENTRTRKLARKYYKKKLKEDKSFWRKRRRIFKENFIQKIRTQRDSEILEMMQDLENRILLARDGTTLPDNKISIAEAWQELKSAIRGEK